MALRTAVPRIRTNHRARSPPVPRGRDFCFSQDTSLGDSFKKDFGGPLRKKPSISSNEVTSTQAAAYGVPIIPRNGAKNNNQSLTSAARQVDVPTRNGVRQPSRLNVVVRKRPLSKKELDGQNSNVVNCINNGVVVKESKLRVDLTKYVEEHNFQFDHSFDAGTTNAELYEVCVRPLVDAALNARAKCTCFAYGQTGSGKTFTMMGGNPKYSAEEEEKEKHPGVFLLAARDIFSILESREHQDVAVYIAFYEIYCGKLFDLLNNRQMLHARENAKSKVVIVGLQEQRVRNGEELMEVIEHGLTGRTTGVTGANDYSSRSHAILQICLKQVDDEGKLINPNEHVGKLSFIDLAGSERGADTLDQDRQTRMDGAEINKSLLALKECIRALDQQLDHTPFRGSKLTQVLKDSFIGDSCYTVMIANVSPCAWAVEHSLNTLRYAYRVKELRRHPVDNNSNKLSTQTTLEDEVGPAISSRVSSSDEEKLKNEAETAVVPTPSTTTTSFLGTSKIQGRSSDKGSSPATSSSTSRAVTKEEPPSVGLSSHVSHRIQMLESSLSTSGVHQPLTSTQQQQQQQKEQQQQHQHHLAAHTSGSGAGTPHNLAASLGHSPNTPVRSAASLSVQRSHDSAQANATARADAHARSEGAALTGSGLEQPQPHQQSTVVGWERHQEQRLFERVPRMPAAEMGAGEKASKLLLPTEDTLVSTSPESASTPSTPHGELFETHTQHTAQHTHMQHHGSTPANHQKVVRVGAQTQGGVNRAALGRLGKTRTNSIESNDEERENWSRDTGVKEAKSSAQLAKAHDRLIGTILAEEEELISTHKKHIDAMCLSVKEEMQLLHKVDKPGSDVDSYVVSLDKILAEKIESIYDLRHKLSVFQNHLLEEDALSKQFQQRSSAGK